MRGLGFAPGRRLTLKLSGETIITTKLNIELHIRSNAMLGIQQFLG